MDHRLLVLSVLLIYSYSQTAANGITIQPIEPALFETESISLTCMSSSPPPYTWLRDGMVLSGETSDTLVLDNIALDWDGSTVTCVVGGLGNTSVTITVYSAAPVFTEHPRSQNVSSGQDFTLSCVARGLSTPVIQWYKDGGVFTLLAPNSEGDLVFMSATDEVAGQYFCRATNDHGNGPVFSDTATITVHFAPEFTVQPDLMYDVLNNTMAVLNCSAKGNPSPTYSWLHNGELITPSDRIEVLDNGTLVIEAVTMMDMGMYRCQATNSLGTVESDNAALMVDLFPLFRRTPESTTVAIGDPAVLNCSAFAIPTADYEWTHNNDPVEIDNDRVTLVNGSLVFSQVLHNDSGSYVCFASNLYGEIMSPEADLIVQGPPLPPNVTLLEVGPTWLFLTWIPDPHASPPVSESTLLYRLSFANITTELKGLRVPAYNLTSLYPHADYVVQVVSESPAGSSDPSPPLQGTRTLTGLPEGEGVKNGPDELQIEHISPHHLMVHWTVPEELRRTSYVSSRVYLLNMGSEVVSTDAAESPLSLTDLTPATDYSVELAFLFQGDHMGPRTRRQVTTMDGLPSSPENVTVQVDGPYNLTVTWSIPSQPNGTIIAYTIRVLPGDMVIVVSGNDTIFDIDGLEAYTVYTVSVSANTSAGEGPQGMAEAIRTAEDVPPPPTALSVETLSSTALLLSWQPPSDIPGVLTGYVIQYNSDIMTFNPTMTSVVIATLIPYTRYIVSVAAVTGAGQGTFSEVMDARTLGDVPTSVPTIVSVEPSCPNDLLVTWMNSDLSGLNGPINETRLIVSVVSGGSVYRMPELEYLPANQGNFTIENVTHFTNFSVSMAIRNTNGTGATSDNVTVTSCDALADPPLGVTVTTVNATMVHVAWQPVEEVMGLLVGYIVTYNSQSVNTRTDRTSILLTDLTPYTEYTVSVASETRSGLGLPSSAETVRTDPDVPTSVLTIVSVEPSCPNDLLVTWMNSDPSGLNGPINETRLIVSVVSTIDSHNSSIPYTSSKARVTGLILNTSYTVRLSITNNVGVGPLSSSVTAHTLTEGLSTPPRDPQPVPLSPTAIQVSWQRPLNPNGDPNYIVSYRIAELAEMTVSTTSLSVNLTGLQVFTEYEIAVSANTSCGQSESTKVIGVTGQILPTAPVNLEVVSVLPKTVVLKWREPVSPNGAPIEYEIFCGRQSVTTSMLSFECDELEPNTEYTFAVRANNSVGSGPPVSTMVTTTCQDPPSMLMLGADGQLLVSLANVTDGCTPTAVLFVLVLVQKLVPNDRDGYVMPSRSFNDYTLDQLVELTRSYDNRRGRRQTDPVVYITANVSDIDLQTGGVMIGDDMDYDGYTNHPLTPGVFYNVGLRGVVAGTTTPVFADSAVADPITAVPPEPITTMTTDPLPVLPIAISAGAAAVVLFAILLVACIICACAYCNRRASKYVVANGTGRMERSSSFRLSSKRKATDPVDEFRANHRTEELEDHPPVPVMGFINRLMVMRTNDNQLFLEEFGSISMTPHHSTEVADSSPNKRRNRYNNILPYDNNRIKLKTHNSTDYINASYCAGYMKHRTYIATQGPIAETVPDFWRMVWEENVKTVIMLTNVSEKGKVKCETYWPRDLGCSSMHGHIEVIMDQVTQLADFTIRTFSLHKSGSSKEPRIVKQFHFTSWPDHGVPQYATAMLSMLRRVRSYHSKVTGGPMLVHCSAGVGRTGTFIVIDSMLERLKNSDSLLDIYGHVTLLRTQRNFMVQTEDQYFFIHEALAEALLCGNTEVTLEGLGGYVSELNTVVSGEDSDSTHIEVQFKRLAVDKNDPYRFVTANKDANKHKNRLVNILPYETNRVVLEYLRGVDGSDYINASHIDSYHNRRAFIATQGPLPHTCGDFWRMVWQYNSPVIVMLTELVEKGQERCSQYWPAEVLQNETHDRFIVELAVERRSEHYTFRDINITDTQSGQKRCVSHFQFHAWPETGTPATPTILLDFIREVQKMYSNLSTKAPITVHCSSGVGRTGVFITLHITLERMVTEGLVDVFQTVKNLRIQRPAMVQTLQQYQFCYESALHYLESSDLLLTRQRPSVEVTRKRSFRHTPPSSQASPARSTTTTPSRTESFKRSSKNFEMSGNQGAHIYGGSEATSTFGSHRQTTNNHTLSGSQTLVPPYGSQSQLYGGSQSNLSARYGGSQSQLNSQPNSGVHMRNASMGGLGTPHVPHQLAESKRYSNSSAGWGADTQ